MSEQREPRILDKVASCALCKLDADYVYTIRCSDGVLLYFCTECSGKVIVRAIEELPQLRATIKAQADDLAVLANEIDTREDRCNTCASTDADDAACHKIGSKEEACRWEPSPAVALAIKYRGGAE